MRHTKLRGAEGQESAEAGYMLLAVIFMMALVLLSLAIAAPKIAAAIQRDRELELIRRGEQYKRAIRLYYKKFGNYPSSIDQLEKTNNIRFLRKRYLDPLTGKDDWKPVLLGQAHLCPLGFFGQPLGTGSAIAGATSVAALAGSTLGGSSSTTGSSFSSSSFGTSTGSNPAVGGTGSSVPGCGTGGSASSPIGGGTGSGASDSGSSNGSGSSGGSQGGTGSSGSGASTTAISTTLGEGLTPSTGFGAATSTTLGGAPIQGVMPPSTKATILLYKLKTHYNEWEFDYWPAEDQMAAGSIAGGGGNINGSGNSVNGPGGSSGNSSNTGLSGGPGGTGGSSFGGSGSSGSGFGSTSNGNGSSGQSGNNPP